MFRWFPRVSCGFGFASEILHSNILENYPIHDYYRTCIEETYCTKKNNILSDCGQRCVCRRARPCVCLRGSYVYSTRLLVLDLRLTLYLTRKQSSASDSCSLVLHLLF